MDIENWIKCTVQVLIPWTCKSATIVFCFLLEKFFINYLQFMHLIPTYVVFIVYHPIRVQRKTKENRATGKFIIIHYILCIVCYVISHYAYSSRE